mmetsp:Transcript_43212/g.104283  ORF Transcript_43212/g.104283 Transcript_43212/m.104283 type:complete len:220 (-) Transcript_43212:935-1594(-)
MLRLSPTKQLQELRQITRPIPILIQHLPQRILLRRGRHPPPGLLLELPQNLAKLLRVDLRIPTGNAGENGLRADSRGTHRRPDVLEESAVIRRRRSGTHRWVGGAGQQELLAHGFITQTNLRAVGTHLKLIAFCKKFRNPRRSTPRHFHLSELGNTRKLHPSCLSFHERAQIFILVQVLLGEVVGHGGFDHVLVHPRSLPLAALVAALFTATVALLSLA